MTQKTSSGYTLFSVFYRCPRLMQGLSLISGLSVLSSTLVLAQAESPVDPVAKPKMPTANTTVEAAPAKESIPKPAAPELIIESAAPAHKPARETERDSLPKPTAPAVEQRIYSETKPTAPVREPEAKAPEPATEVPKKPALAAPNLSIPNSAIADPPPKVLLNPVQIQESAKTPVVPPDSYIDRTNYGIGANRRYDAPGSVVLKERSTGCQTVSQNGQLLRGVCGVAASGQQTANSLATLLKTQLNEVTKLPSPPVVTMKPANLSPLRGDESPIPATGQTLYSPRESITPPVSSYYSPGSGGAASPEGLAYYHLTTRPAGFPSIGKNSFMFPLTIPAAITSVFGWRIHPISGEYRFHAGTDLGAPEGTPVIAAVSGQVVTADFLGGYGLTVILKHEKGDESLYGHLSEIFVKPGDRVEQGNVIGRVGNTGNSTGPHLHFEWRHLTSDGLVAVDAGAHLQYALAQFIRALQLAQSTPQRGT